nr:hypothetical protein [Cupriavidus sp. EM10]
MYNIDDVFADPHFVARDSIQHRPHDRLGMVAVPNVTPRLTETPGYVRGWAATPALIPPPSLRECSDLMPTPCPLCNRVASSMTPLSPTESGCT